MTREQIETLSQEYARAMWPESCKKLGVEWANGRFRDRQHAQQVLEWLSERFYIVDKIKMVKELENTYPGDVDRGIVNIMVEKALKRLID